MDFQFNTDSSVTGSENVAERIEEQVRSKLARFEDKLSRLEVHVRDENSGSRGGPDDKRCMIEARPNGGKPVSVTAHSDTVDGAARSAASKLATLLDRHFGKGSGHRS